GVVPHPAVHGRRDQHGPAGGEEDRGQEVVGDALRRLGQEVGGGRRDHDGVRALGQRHVLDRVGALGIEEVREHGTAGERAEGEGAYELARVLGQADGGAGAERGELAQEVHRLVGRDGPGDAEDQLFSIEGCHQALVSPSSFTRYSTFACEISSSATLVGFFCLDSTRAAAPRLIWRSRRRAISFSASDRRSRSRCSSSLIDGATMKTSTASGYRFRSWAAPCVSMSRRMSWPLWSAPSSTLARVP